MTSLLLSGSFARFRDIRWLFSHAGGTIPMMAGRINSFYGARPDLKEFAPEGIEGELRRLHYDTANATFAPSMAALMKLVPISQITYGTDYPYFGFDQFAELQKLGLRQQISPPSATTTRHVSFRGCRLKAACSAAATFLPRPRRDSGRLI